MIRLEEQLGFCAESAPRARHTLEGLLDLRWRSYCKAYKRCRKKFSENSVHVLRVEIRRMMSALSLVAAVVPHDPVLDAECELKAHLKALSRLRDTQVQIQAVAEMLEEA